MTNQTESEIRQPRLSERERLGELLCTLGVLNEQDLEIALAYKKERGMKLGQALVELRMVSQADLAGALRHQGKVHCVHLYPKIIDREVAQSLGEENSRRFKALAINRIAGVVTVAVEDPNESFVVDDIASCLQSEVLAVHAEPARIAECIESVFGRDHTPRIPLEEIARQAALGGMNVQLDGSWLDEGESGRGGLDRPVIELVRGILEEAGNAGASGVHFETLDNRFTIRFRIDGSLSERISLAKGWARPCIARVQSLANLDLSLQRLPQHGRCQLVIRGQRCELEVEVSPGLFGHNAVIRFLGSFKKPRKLGELGFDTTEIERLELILDSKNGLLLAAGPTNSGKTTTLHALLDRRCASDAKVITLEDPVECQIEGVSQIPVRPEAGFTFAAALRSALRQDPDVILVGDIRDRETAALTVEAALTGHFVLSSVHSAGGAECIARLIDLGVEPFLVADALKGVVAQRLLRRLCGHCRRPAERRPDLEKRLGLSEDSSAFFESTGCKECSGTGYKGRLALYEVVAMTPELSSLVCRSCGSEVLRNALRRMGFASLREAGLRHARDGATSLMEVLSATAQN